VGGVCKGAAAGALCYEFEDCEFGYYCANLSSTCVPQVELGGECDPLLAPSLSECTIGLSCSSQGKCIVSFSLIEGQECFYSTSNIWNGNDDCGYGLYCGSDGKCAKYQSPSISCQDATQCGSAGGSCLCNYFEKNAHYQCGTNYSPTPSICRDSLVSASNCFEKNKCKGTFTLGPNTCAEKHCKSENECALGCTVYNTDPLVSFVAAGCVVLPVLPCVSGSTGATGYGTGYYTQTGLATGSATGSTTGHASGSATGSNAGTTTESANSKTTSGNEGGNNANTNVPLNGLWVL